jgi:hypothetical protein
MTTPAPKTTWVCDWTHWQGMTLPAWGVANEGYGMVKLKAGGASAGGRFFEDPKFHENAIALVNEPRLIPAAYWYLMPGRATAQAGLFYDILAGYGVHTWAAFLDVEERGLSFADVRKFAIAWERLTAGQPLALYTSRRVWQTLGEVDGNVFFRFLEEAHWVPEAVRKDPARPYASQQARFIDRTWWDVNYGGWGRANMIQFTDNALVMGKRTTASLYPGTQAQLRAALIG